MPIHPIKKNRGLYTGQEFGKSKKDWNSYLESLKDLELYFKSLGFNICLFYGSLLGAVREHAFIAHDHDIDLIYISNYNSKIDVKSEALSLYNKLLEDDMLIEEKRDSNSQIIGQAHIFSPKRRFIFDLWTSYIDQSDNLFVSPFIEPIAKGKDLFPFKMARLYQRAFKIPNNYDIILKKLYGNYSIPDPKGKPKMIHGNILC